MRLGKHCDCADFAVDAIPFSNRARAQNYSPPLNASWNYQSDRIFGVNLGGWLHRACCVRIAIC